MVELWGVEPQSKSLSFLRIYMFIRYCFLFVVIQHPKINPTSNLILFFLLRYDKKSIQQRLQLERFQLDQKFLSRLQKCDKLTRLLRKLERNLRCLRLFIVVVLELTSSHALKSLCSCRKPISPADSVQILSNRAWIIIFFIMFVNAALQAFY